MVYTLTRFYIIFIPVALVVDLILWGYMQAPVGCFSLALLYTLVCVHVPLLGLIAACFGALWFRFILTGMLGIDLVVILPLSIGYYYFFRVADIPRPFMVAAVFAGLLVQRVAVDVSFDSVGILLSFLSSMIMVYSVVGSQGNRLQ